MQHMVFTMDLRRLAADTIRVEKMSILNKLGLDCFNTSLWGKC
jgi:hypothetical protein